MLARCRTRCADIREIISELTDLVAIETGRFPLRRTPINVYDAVDEVAQLYHEKAIGQNIELDWHTEPGAQQPKAMADANAVRCIVGNLVDNAIKYNNPGGRVEIRVDNDDVSITVTVTDDGIGMTEAEKEKVFEEFFRARNENTRGRPGTGLGLSVVKRLAELHGGNVAVSTAPNEGSAFSVSLPLAHDKTGGTE